MARMPALGSTAITVPGSACRTRVSLPVPAARSTTVLRGPTPSRCASRATASGGYDGRERS
jgi:hypothetical protein